MNVARILKDKGRDVATISPDTTIKDTIDLLAKEKDRSGGRLRC